MRFSTMNKGVEVPEGVELVSFEWIDTDYIRIPEIPLFRLDIKGKRHYVKITEEKTELFPSVTTILHETMNMEYGLLDWHISNGWDKTKEILEITSAYGTEMHIIFSKLVIGDTIDFIDLMDKQKQDIIGFIKWVNDYNVRPLAIEYVVSGDGYAGAIDLVCKMDYKGKEIIAMVDYKTGRTKFYKSNIVQSQAYRKLWDKEHPDLKIDRIFNYGCKDYRLPIGKTVTPYRFEDHTEKTNILANWDLYLQIYQNENPEIKTKKQMYVNLEEVNSKTDISKLYEEVDLLEKIQEDKNEQD